MYPLSKSVEFTIGLFLLEVVALYLTTLESKLIRLSAG